MLNEAEQNTKSERTCAYTALTGTRDRPSSTALQKHIPLYLSKHTQANARTQARKRPSPISEIPGLPPAAGAHRCWCGWGPPNYSSQAQHRDAQHSALRISPTADFPTDIPAVRPSRCLHSSPAQRTGKRAKKN